MIVKISANTEFIALAIIKITILFYKQFMNFLTNCLFSFLFQLQYPMTVLCDANRKKDPPPEISAQYINDHDQCMKYFEKWSETEQVHFVEQLLARMCHY